MSKDFSDLYAAIAALPEADERRRPMLDLWHDLSCDEPDRGDPLARFVSSVESLPGDACWRWVHEFVRSGFRSKYRITVLRGRAVQRVFFIEAASAAEARQRAKMETGSSRIVVGLVGDSLRA